MLSETFVLQQALERAGVEIPEKHPRVKSFAPSGGPCLRVRLDSNGHVTTVEAITREEWPGLWTVREGNQNSFPVVRVAEPFQDVPYDDTAWKSLGFNQEGKRNKSPEIKARLAILQTVFKTTDQRYPKRSEAFWKRLVRKADELLAHAGDSIKYKILTEFARRFHKAGSNPQKLMREVAEHSLTNLQQARLDALDTVETLLVGKGPPDKNGTLPDMKVQLVFDLDDEHAYSLRLYNQQIRAHVERVLPAEHDTDSKTSHPASICAFTGKSQPLQVSSFPAVKLPVLNKELPLVSMFSEAACNSRYGLTDSLIVPVSQIAARRMQDALSYIVAEQRKGKTWRSVANGKFEVAKRGKKELADLLIVYVDGKPNIDANIADLFGTDTRQQQKLFEIDAQAVCEALDGIEREQPGLKLNLFLLRKASEGQAHVVVAESPSVKEILNAAEWWQQAAANVPKITLPLPREKSEKATQGKPSTPYPDQIVRLLSEDWVANGKRSIKVRGIGLGEVLDLMLRKPGSEITTQRILAMAVERSAPLLLGIFGANHADDPKRWKDYSLQSRQIALQVVSVLGLLLAASARWKEEYMNGSAFLLGRLLSLSDTLHREYCMHVRDGSIPPQLIGNALMPAAAERPQDTLDRLRERMMIYKAWSDRATGDEHRLAKWAVGQMGQVCNQLAEVTLPMETDQVFRAELFLGYMARPSRE
ncbi:MAG TPA: type I-C CRISPR-associated protein Cas8c/Csd1 [Nitrospira sp.]|nr:type I-C CRISPR-associated protein Cas8c/Csd1 [Nitrospira sp.]